MQQPGFGWLCLRLLANSVKTFPIERWVKNAPAQQDNRTIARPGCTAADESLVVAGHLQGLASGRGGFGVLRTSAERLEAAAKGAEGMGDFQTAAQLRAFKARLPAVRTAEQARAAAQDLEPLLEKTWELGKRCGGSGHPEIGRIRELAERVRRGEITIAQAEEMLR